MTATPSWKKSGVARTDYAKSATIADAGTVSDVVDLEGLTLVGLFVPASLDGTTITFKAAQTVDGTLYPVRDGTVSPAAFTVTISATTAAYYALPAALFAGVRFLQLVVSSQTGAVSVGLALKGV
jgi:hypothetical protein